MSSEMMSCAHVFWEPKVPPAMALAHFSGFSNLRLALGARAGHCAPSLYADVTVPLPPVEVRHLALTMAGAYAHVDFLATTSVPT